MSSALQKEKVRWGDRVRTPLQWISDISEETTVKERPKMKLSPCLGIAVERGCGWRVNAKALRPEQSWTNSHEVSMFVWAGRNVWEAEVRKQQDVRVARLCGPSDGGKLLEAFEESVTRWSFERDTPKPHESHPNKAFCFEAKQTGYLDSVGLAHLKMLDTHMCACRAGRNVKEFLRG